MTTEINTFQEYINIYNDSIKKYGPKTAVLYQCGSFYELYGVDNDTEKLGNIEEITNVLNIQLTRKKKAISENNRSNPLFAGVNMASGDKFIKILIDNGYTVVLVNQEEKNKAKGNFKRSISQIYSPATYIDNNQMDNYLVCIYINKYEIGLCAFDISASIIKIYNIINKKTAQLCLEDSILFLQAFKPKEIIIINTIEKMEINYRERFDLSPNIIIHLKTIAQIRDFENIKFQNTFLSDFYETGFLSPIEFLNIEHYNAATTALCFLFNFCIEHNKELLGNVKNIPIHIWNDSGYLILENNASAQLNLNELYNLFNENMKTKMGSRLLKDYLFTPITDIDLLNNRYDIIDKLKVDPITNYFKYMKLDINKYNTKIGLNKIKLTELVELIDFYNYACVLVDYVILNDIMNINIEYYDKFKELLVLLGSILKKAQAVAPEEQTEANIKQNGFNPFNKEYAPEIYEIEERINNNITILKEIGDIMERMLISVTKAATKAATKVAIDNDKKQIYLSYSNDNGYHYFLTNIRYNNLKSCFKPFIHKLINVNIENFAVGRITNGIKLYDGDIDTINKDINKDTAKMNKLIEMEYDKLLCKIKTYNKYYIYITNVLAELDLFNTMAQISIIYNYVRPKINLGESYINVTNLRHPLIERQDMTYNKYIPFTIDLHQNNICGMLLYGINSSGKSSTMKAVGLAVIMAQAGFFVPCENMELGLYKNIMTRILNMDNIFKGLSSFAVEMIELKTIIDRMSENSLILGDEICHGTETNSAVSIVAASIIILSQTKASFIFATHLHKLAEITEINNLTNVKHYHLTVKCDEETGELIYDRKLKPGAGDSNYGIEVAKFLKISPELISLAIDIRAKYFINKMKKSSKYNKGVICDNCKICNMPAVDIHHIYQQGETNNDYVDNIYIHDKSNLVPLCEIHHNMVHNVKTYGENELIIFGYENDELQYTIRPHKF